MKIAIIGFGPRGLACLENLILTLSRTKGHTKIELLIFEPSENLGTGKAWDINQPDTNYINISDHALQDLKGREKIIWGKIKVPSFPSYTQWCLTNEKIENIAGDKDVYPPRSQMGRYLIERAKSICGVLRDHKLLEIKKEMVQSIRYKEGRVYIKYNAEQIIVSECLLTIGHIPEKDSEETVAFKKHAKNEGISYVHNPYETEIAQQDMPGNIVAIKGFGLSMLDITRQLTCAGFGTFQKKKNSEYLEFTAKNGCVASIIPYSFDGLPCVPKPFGRKVDSTFEPTQHQKNTFELALRNGLVLPEKIKSLDFLLDAFAQVAVSIFLKNNEVDTEEKEIMNLTKKWLHDPETSHSLLLDTKLSVVAYMKQTVEMAWGEIPPTLDFTIGQVWRHLQPIMYRMFAFSGMSGTLMSTLVKIDQATKRYSFGHSCRKYFTTIGFTRS